MMTEVLPRGGDSGKRHGRRASRGSVLLLVLWVMGLLAGLAVAAGVYAGSASRAASRLQSDAVAAGIAGTGVMAAVQAVMRDTNGWDAASEAWGRSDLGLGGGRADAAGRFALFHDCDSPPARAPGLCDEDRKVNVNTADLPVLAALLTTVGMATRQEAAGIAEAIADWRDADDEPMPNGAESAYYGGLRPPRRCRNAAMLSVWELALVKGMRREVFDRVRDHVTVYGDGRVNVNTAGQPVLKTLAASVGAADPAACDSLAAKIVKARARLVFKDASWNALAGALRDAQPLTARESALLRSMANRGLLSVQSRCFSGISLGVLLDQREHAAGVRFVCDRRTGSIEEWHEQ